MKPIVERVQVLLNEDEWDGLVRLAEAELRPVDDQLRMILRQILHQHGYLDNNTVPIREGR